jgi:acyl dehydratase
MTQDIFVAGASGGHNPIAIDTELARRAGMPDVFAQGMLGMAWPGQVVGKLEVAGERFVRIEVRSANQYGQAPVALPGHHPPEHTP